jgi:hypothetical protein
MFMSHQNRKIHTTDKSSENVSMFKYLGMTLTLIKKLTEDQIWEMTGTT